MNSKLALQIRSNGSVDLQSKNRTFLNGRHLSPDHPVLLRLGDEIRASSLRRHVDFRRDENPS